MGFHSAYGSFVRIRRHISSGTVIDKTARFNTEYKRKWEKLLELI